MSIFDAERKPGCSVGCSIVVTDENGKRISDGPQEWHGFERAVANQMAMDVIGAITGIIEGYRELKGEQKKAKGK